MSNDNIFNWLNNEITRNQTYHDHKENMAWVATALYVTGAVGAGLALRSQIGVGSKPLTIIIFMLVSISTVIFVYWQFHNRLIAARKIEGLIRTTSLLHSQSGQQLSVLNWTINDDWNLPTFVVENMPPQNNFMGVRFASELITGIIILIALIVFVLLVCW